MWLHDEQSQATVYKNWRLRPSRHSRSFDRRVGTRLHRPGPARGPTAAEVFLLYWHVAPGHLQLPPCQVLGCHTRPRYGTMTGAAVLSYYYLYPGRLARHTAWVADSWPRIMQPYWHAATQSAVLPHLYHSQACDCYKDRLQQLPRWKKQHPMGGVADSSGLRFYAQFLPTQSIIAIKLSYCDIMALLHRLIFYHVSHSDVHILLNFLFCMYMPFLQ